MTKYIIVSGGVVSGIGKGVIGMCLQAYLSQPRV
jgi:CTP synthase (UTP-ammonia lyase)